MDFRIALEPQTKLSFYDKSGGEICYTIVREIGRGSSCIVYEASHETNTEINRLYRIKECYPYMKKYVSFMSANAPRGLVAYKNRECLGDWNAPWREQIPSRFANTCMFVDALYALQKVAKLTDNEGDIVAYAKEIERLKKDRQS